MIEGKEFTMKKQILIALLLMVLAFSAAGCGNAQSKESEPEDMQIVKKTPTEGEKDLMDMAGLSTDTTTGLLQYNADKSVKSAELKIVEYSSKTGKWKEIYGSVQSRAGKNGRLMVIYYNEGAEVRVSMSDGKGALTSGERSLSKISGEGGITYADLQEAVPIELNKDIPVYMTAEGKKDEDSFRSIDLEDYQNVQKLKEYEKVRVVVVKFLDKAID